MRKFLLTFTLLLPISHLTTACTTTRDANESLSQNYHGTAVNSFFVKFGLPTSQHHLDNGKIIYIWADQPTVYDLPSPSNTTVNITSDTGVATTTTSPGRELAVECQVKIIVSSGGIIEDIETRSGFKRGWNLKLENRCVENFPNTNKIRRTSS
jgi:hypothetical protein